MNALVLESNSILKFKQVAEPEPFGEMPVLVRIAAVGVCGSDYLRFSKGKAYHYPLVMGHEFSAIVEQAPAGSQHQRGDRVTVFPLLPNYHDPLSRIGEYAVSLDYDYFGSRRDGAFAELLYVPEQNLIPIPDGLSLIYAALTEPAAVALHGVRKFNIPAFASSLVIGCGAIGAFAAQWLRILGCSRVIAADVDPRKLEIMAGMGFECIDARREDTVDAVMNRTNQRGVDCIVEASGQPATLIQALNSATVFGQVLLLGDMAAEVSLSASLLSTFIRHEVSLLGSWNSKMTPPGQSEWEMVLHHMCRDLQVAPLISHTVTLSEGPQIFADISSQRTWYSKVVFVISEEAQADAARLPRVPFP